MPDPKAPSPNYNPYGKAAKNETAAQKKARQKKFYTFQREHAEETGDQKTVDKIYGKLGKKSRNVDADSVNKKALAYGPALAAGGALGIGRALAGRAAAGAMAKNALSSGQKALGPGLRTATRVAPKASMRKIQGAVPRLTGGAQKALPAARGAAPGVKAAIGPRSSGSGAARVPTVTRTRATKKAPKSNAKPKAKKGGR